MRPDSRWVVPTLLMLLALAVVTVPILAQEEAAEDEVAADDDFMQATPRPEIDEYLDSEMEVFAGEGETYDPGDRRDPFISLIVPSQAVVDKGPRPPGIPGLMVDEIEVTGIFITAQGPVAQVKVTNKRQSYLLREGDQLYDGDVTSIAFNEVVFKQILDDPAALKPFRPVVKKLKPQGGGR